MRDLSAHLSSALLDSTKRQGASGYFGAPVRPNSGPLRDYILTAYRSGRDPEVQETLARRHDAYVDCLRLAGLRVPETHLRLLDDAGSLRPVIAQRCVEPKTMLADLMRQAGPEAAVGLLDRVATDVAEFWRRVALRPERVGLHAQIDRFAMDEQGPLFLDTFPPLISYSRDEMGQFIQRFADNGLLRGLGKVLPGRLREMQDRWYTPAGSISTLIEGALRLCPENTEAILDWSHGFATSRLESPWRGPVQTMLARHARAHAKASGQATGGGHRRDGHPNA